ncbi:hypothetical protein TanjilG_19469 [Lupinus angustifolius]|uniref:Uncharacterized protein n=1 Tax=Lupinus angustifolius TaxID=3871 RepID=A0A4P1R4M8_LUPAN|nr:hypothetical protein TanjilG_19469 [Lupinus angustifolius]
MFPFSWDNGIHQKPTDKFIYSFEDLDAREATETEEKLNWMETGRTLECYALAHVGALIRQPELSVNPTDMDSTNFPGSGKGKSHAPPS